MSGTAATPGPALTAEQRAGLSGGIRQEGYQYGRQLSLIVADAGGRGLDLSELRVRFTVRQWELQTPNVADIRVTNLSSATMSKVRDEFKQVILQAGYAGQMGTIFKGTIVQARIGRESQTDTYLDITAYDGDTAHNFAVVNTTLSAGATPDAIVAASIAAMKEHGVTQGPMPPLPGPALPRGRVLYGMARDHLRDVADQTDTVWNIQDGQVCFQPKTGYMPSEAIVLNSATGLIGLPQQTQDGIAVRCLLNPRLRCGNIVTLNNATIQKARFDPTWAGQNLPQEALFPKFDADGTYRILAIDYSGDTRGQEWYCELCCVAVTLGEGGLPQGQVRRGRVGTDLSGRSDTGAPIASPTA